MGRSAAPRSFSLGAFPGGQWFPVANLPRDELCPGAQPVPLKPSPSCASQITLHRVLMASTGSCFAGWDGSRKRGDHVVCAQATAPLPSSRASPSPCSTSTRQLPVELLLLTHGCHSDVFTTLSFFETKGKKSEL